MKIIKSSIVFLLILCFAISLPADSFSTDREKQEQAMSAEEQKMVKRWKELATPGERHKHLRYFVGEWESVQKIWAEPGAEPLQSAQEISVKLLYGGRFTEAHIKFKQEFFGVKIEGTVITGYNNYTGKFFSVTFGNDSTGYSSMSGTLDKTGKVRTDHIEIDDFMTGKKVKFKAITTIINKDKYTYESYQVDSKGNEVKYMEVTYYREKGAGSPIP
ncbi:MAG: DUF1579 family protein [Candidatus Aminicenantes bacterium]|nr:DUF1579 family protein [Candidatus Aminicenantes bacterium]